MSNAHGAIGLIGRPGSGKSRISWILQAFFNGFLFQDSEKGIAEFWNQDIASKSFIHAEEINLNRLCTSDWKVLADIEASIKCHVKNKEDIEATKYVPVVMTSNGDVYQQVITQAIENESMDAAHRRWIFIRFFNKWADSHPEVVNTSGNICNEFREIYAKKTTDYEIMNGLIGCALMFNMHNFVDVQYMHSYYYHCLLKFVETIFGQVALVNFHFIYQQVERFTQIYSQCADAICQQAQLTFQQEFELLIIDYLNSILLPEEMFITQRNILINTNISLHQRCLLLGICDKVKDKLIQEAPLVLERFLFLSKNKHSLYKGLLLMMVEKKLSTNEMLTAEIYYGQENEEQQDYTMEENKSFLQQHNDDSIIVSEEDILVASYLKAPLKKAILNHHLQEENSFQFESSLLDKNQSATDNIYRAFSLY